MNSQMSNVENLSPQIIRQVVKELQGLQTNALEGIKVLINEADVTDIQAIIDGPAGTPYANGAFRVKLTLPKDFPSHPPKAFFLTKIFHPNVAANGEICVNTLKKDWKSDLGIQHILLTIKCLLIVPNPESALNEEAGKLLLEHYDDYSQRARIYTEIHAKAPKSCSSNSTNPNEEQNNDQDDQPSSSKSKKLQEKVIQDKKKEKLMKEKKRILKRL
uniref:Ubiquitin-conjugating enzyme E2 S n=1 Tax=Culicoides sonorensis TaxID=179676 RepID=A0A336M6H1_CULSO